MLGFSCTRTTAALAVVSVACCAGCVVDDGIEPVDHITWLAMRASDVRELGYLEPVPLAFVSAAAFAAAEEERARNIDEAELQEFAETWGRLGYFPVDADLRPRIADMHDWVGGFYSADDGSITVIGTASDGVLLHEHVHALQDQHFDLAGYQDTPTSDAEIARRAITEGDAELGEARFFAQSAGAELEHLVWDLQVARDASERVLEEAELPLLEADRAFVYNYGLEYTLANLTGWSIDAPEYTRPTPFDWRRENGLFAERAPRSAWEVLHKDASPPQGSDLVGIGEVPAELAGELETVEWDTLGSWYTYVLLRPVDGEDGVGELRPLVESWRGDRVLFVQDGDAYGVVWASAWEDEDRATQLAAAFQALHGVVLDQLAPGLAGVAEDGEAAWIERRGEKVVVMKNVDVAHAAALAEAAVTGAPPPAAEDEASSPDSNSAPARRKLGAWVDRLSGSRLHRAPPAAR